MQSTEQPRLLCKESDLSGHEGEALCTAFFEAQTFEKLGEKVTTWLLQRPDHEVVSLSHSTGVRQERSYDTVSWGRNEFVSVYTAMLLFRPTSGKA